MDDRAVADQDRGEFLQQGHGPGLGHDDLGDRVLPQIPQAIAQGGLKASIDRLTADIDAQLLGGERQIFGTGGGFAQVAKHEGLHQARPGELALAADQPAVLGHLFGHGPQERWHRRRDPCEDSHREAPSSKRVCCNKRLVKDFPFFVEPSL